MIWTITLILLFFTLSVLFWSTNVYENEKAMKYISVISVISTLVFIVSIVMSIERGNDDRKRRDNDDEKKRASDFINETEKNWIGLEKYFSDNYPYLDQLYRELYPENTSLSPITLTDEQQLEANYKQVHACQILYQTIENLINTEPDIKKEKYGWFKIFSNWGKSDIFKKNWAFSKTFYNPTTQKFIEELTTLN